MSQESIASLEIEKKHAKDPRKLPPHKSFCTVFSCLKSTTLDLVEIRRIFFDDLLLVGAQGFLAAKTLELRESTPCLLNEHKNFEKTILGKNMSLKCCLVYRPFRLNKITQRSASGKKHRSHRKTIEKT